MTRPVNPKRKAEKHNRNLSISFLVLPHLKLYKLYRDEIPNTGTSEGRKTAYRHVREKLTNIDHHSPSVIGQTRNEIKSNHPWCGSGLACGSPGCTCYLILSDHLKAWLAGIGCQEWSFEWTESRWVAREPVFVISISFLVGIANSQTRRFLSAISTLT